MEPAGQGFSLANVGGSPRQEKKGRLEGIFGILLVAKHASTYGQDQRAVPLHDRAEGTVVSLAEKCTEQLPISPGSVAGAGSNVAEVTNDRSQLSLGHRILSEDS
jgi:hypothetical protein